MSSKHCVVGYYFSKDDILEAASRTNARGFKKYDTFSPFPIHGMDKAMGIKRSKVPYVGFAAGSIGFFTAIGLTVWTHGYSYPLNIGGKPIMAIPAYIPIIFELTVLFCGVITALSMFTLFCRLPNYGKPIFHPDITNDRFALAIETETEDEIEPVKKFLNEIKAQEVHHVKGVL